MYTRTLDTLRQVSTSRPSDSMTNGCSHGFNPNDHINNTNHNNDNNNDNTDGSK